MNRKTVFAIMRRELSAYFSGPVAYIVIAVFLLLTGFLFFKDFFYYKQAEMRNFFQLLPLLFTVFASAMTMRLFAEERQTGSIEMLLTMPVTPFEAVLGKLCAGCLFVCAALAPTLFYAATVFAVGSPDIGPIIGGYIGAVLLGSACASVGLFTSVCCKNQITAFITGLACNLGLWLLSRITVFLPAKVRFLEYFGTDFHFQNIAKGLLDIRDVVYFVSVIAIGLLLSVRVIESRSKQG